MQLFNTKLSVISHFRVSFNITQYFLHLVSTTDHFKAAIDHIYYLIIVYTISFKHSPYMWDFFNNIYIYIYIYIYYLKDY